MRSVRSAGAKRIDYFDRAAQDWYDLGADPGELRAGETPPAGGAAGAFEQVLARLQTFVENRPAAAVSPQVSSEVERQLEALGYTGGDDEP